MVFRGGGALDGGTIGSEARMVCTVSAIIEVARHPLVLTTIVDGIVIIDCDVSKNLQDAGSHNKICGYK